MMQKIEEAREEARKEARKMIDEVREEAREDARKDARDAREEARKMIDEAERKTFLADKKIEELTRSVDRLLEDRGSGFLSIFGSRSKSDKLFRLP
jgi:F0F1-type ATP synthase membrane subunit b/b'